MDILIHHVYRADRKEPLAEMIGRALAAFGAASLVPEITASFADSPDGASVSAVDRALKKYPDLAPLLSTEPMMPGLPEIRQLTGGPGATPFPLDALLAVAEGVPRSLPFNSINVQLGHSEFGGATRRGAPAPGGVVIGDNWWVNGRKRSLSALYIVAGDPDSSELPAPPPGAAAVMDRLGLPRKTTTSLLPDVEGTGTKAAAALQEVLARHRSSLGTMLARADLPHELPPLSEALGQPKGAGPLKPTLAAAFEPRGFDCRGEPGRFVLRRKTQLGNYVVLDVDVGTWSRLVTAQYIIRAAGVEVRMWVPAGIQAIDALQYPIGDGTNWERIVANMAAVVDELDRSLLPEVEQIVGASPEWFQPG